MLRQVDLAISTIYHRVRFQNCNNLYRNFASQAHKTKIMNKVYFRNEPGSTELQISFRYKNPEMNVDREFNFCRTMNENIDDALVRIRNNISKELNKKSKKKQKKPKQQQSQIADATATIPISNRVEVVQDVRKQSLQ